MDELVQWLGEQLDKDGQIARACSGDGKWDERDVVIYAPNLGEEVRAHMVEHDPARVLREVEAKRRLLDEHKPDGWDCSTCAAPETYDDDADGNREWSRDSKSFPCLTVRLLASVYADRPGYREEWRP